MIRNYFKIAFRNLFKDGFYTFINIFGLSVGITACMLIFLYVSNELSYDKFHKDSDRMYRVTTKAMMSETETMYAGVTLKTHAPIHGLKRTLHVNTRDTALHRKNGLPEPTPSAATLTPRRNLSGRLGMTRSAARVGRSLDTGPGCTWERSASPRRCGSG